MMGSKDGAVVERCCLKALPQAPAKPPTHSPTHSQKRE
jgi:hypothetical protein